MNKDKQLIYLLAEALMDMCEQYCASDDGSEWDNLCMSPGEYTFGVLNSLGLVKDYNGRTCRPNWGALKALLND